MARPIATTLSGTNRNKAMLMVALVLGIASFALMFAFLSSRGGSDSSIKKALDVGVSTRLVATSDIKVGDRIGPGNTEVQSVANQSILPGAFESLEAAKDQVVAVPIFVGEQVTAAKVSQANAIDTLSVRVPKGFRALALQVPHEAWIAGGLPQPGDRVDVIGMLTLEKTDPLTGQVRPEVTSGYVVENVEVLAVAQTIVKSVKKAGASATVTPSATAAPSATGTPGANDFRALDSGSTYEAAISITLAVSEVDALRLGLLDALKDDTGQYRIVLRSSGDSEPVKKENKAITLEDIFPPSTKR